MELQGEVDRPVGGNSLPVMRRASSFQLLGIPVRVDPLFLGVMLMLGLTWLSFGAEFLASWMVIGVSSVLLHEFGHALAFRSFGFEPKIALVGLGGLTSAETPAFGSARLTPGRHIVVSLAGPLSTLVLIGIPAVLYQASLNRPDQLTRIVLEQVIFANLYWALLNLLPVLPLDGGQVVASVLEMVFGRRGQQIALVLSLAIGGALLFAGVARSSVILIFLGGIVLAMNVGPLLSSRRRAGSVRAGPGPDDAYRMLVSGQPVAAEAMLLQRLSAPGAPEIERASVELLAWTRLLLGNGIGAQQAMAAMNPPATSQMLYGGLAVHAGRTDEGVALLTWAFLHEPPSESQLLAAILVARAGLTHRFAQELLHTGPTGRDRVQVLSELLAYVGLSSDASVASRSLTAA